MQDIEDILGIEKYDEEIAEKTRYFSDSPVTSSRRCTSQTMGDCVGYKIGDTKSPIYDANADIAYNLYTVVPV